MRDFRGKVEGIRKRSYKSDIQHALNILLEKTKRAAEAFGGSDLADPETLGPTVAESVVPLLREIMMAQTSFSARVSTAKLTPAEKQPLTAMLYTVKMKLGDDLRDLELLRMELADRSAAAPTATGRSVSRR